MWKNFVQETPEKKFSKRKKIDKKQNQTWKKIPLKKFTKKIFGKKKIRTKKTSGKKIKKKKKQIIKKNKKTRDFFFKLQRGQTNYKVDFNVEFDKNALQIGLNILS